MKIFLYKTLWFVVKKLPTFIVYPLFDFFAYLFGRTKHKSLLVYKKNLSIVCSDYGKKEFDELVKNGLKSHFRYWCDIFRFENVTQQDLQDLTRVVEPESLQKKVAAGEKVVVALAHQGNWDHAGAWFNFNVGSIATVVQRVEPEVFFEKFLSLRQFWGMEVQVFGDSGVLINLRRALRRGKVVALLADRDLGENGVEVDFFSQKVKMAAGPALLALSEKVSLYVANTYYERLPAGNSRRWGLVLEFHEIPYFFETDVLRENIVILTQKMADVFAENIRKNPQDWHMFQKFFL